MDKFLIIEILSHFWFVGIAVTLVAYLLVLVLPNGWLRLIVTRIFKVYYIKLLMLSLFMLLIWIFFPELLPETLFNGLI